MNTIFLSILMDAFFIALLVWCSYTDIRKRMVSNMSVILLLGNRAYGAHGAGRNMVDIFGRHGVGCTFFRYMAERWHGSRRCQARHGHLPVPRRAEHAHCLRPYDPCPYWPHGALMDKNKNVQECDPLRACSGLWRGWRCGARISVCPISNMKEEKQHENHYHRGAVPVYRGRADLLPDQKAQVKITADR